MLLFLSQRALLTFDAPHIALALLAAQIVILLLYMLISLLWTETLNIFMGEKTDQWFFKRAKQFRLMNVSWHGQLHFFHTHIQKKNQNHKNKEEIVTPLNGMCPTDCSRMSTACINRGGWSSGVKCASVECKTRRLIKTVAIWFGQQEIK